MKILFLTNLLPYPLDNGGKIKTYTTLNAFATAGYEVDVLCFKECQNSMDNEELQLKKICNRIDQIYLPLTTADHMNYMIKIALKSLVSSLPFSIYKYQSKQMKMELKKRKKAQYDIIYFDHLPMCVFLKYARTLWPNAKFILDEHNCETLIVERKAVETNNLIKKLFFSIEASKLKSFEISSISKTDKVIVLSNTDYDSLKNMTGSEFTHVVIPIGVPDRGLKEEAKNKELKILFIGTLTWEPNNAGLIWFLEEVMPIIEQRNIGIHLYIVGKNPSEEVKRLSGKYKGKVTITGYVDSVDEYYDMCDVTIVPLFIGSGQRVKLIEAFSKGMPAISTSIGAEGLEYIDKESIVIADDKYKFAESIELLQNIETRDKLSHNCRKVYDENYAPEVISSLIIKSVKDKE
mgnify:CR=1 FL=1